MGTVLNMKCVVSGSFRKFYSEIVDFVDELEKCGVEVLSPEKSRPLNPGGEFIVLESDATDDVEIIEKDHLNAISECDFLYLYNPGGYTGKSAVMELGWALAMGKPIYSLEKPDDIVLEKFTEIKSIEEIRKSF